MPLGIVTDEEFESEANSKSTKLVVIEKKHGGRGTGDKDVPEELRKVIAEEAIENGNSKAISEAFGVSEASIAAYKNGATSCSTYNKSDEQLLAHVNRVKSKINNSARGRLTAALKLLTAEKMKGEKPKDLASIAVDMSKIMEKTEPKVAVQNQTNIVIYSPQRVKLASLGEVIDV